jgi:hypothetical protein
MKRTIHFREEKKLKNKGRNCSNSIKGRGHPGSEPYYGCRGCSIKPTSLKPKKMRSKWRQIAYGIMKKI